MNNTIIPKVIHYCWFGGNPLPDLAKKCIESWRKYLPDYEIKEWNESNYNVHKIPYIHEAYDAKKYAFVSDYARFDILYHEGGLYFDTDVEVIRNMDDIINKGAFMGCERECINSSVNPGLGLGVAPGLGLYAEILDGYLTRHFLKEDGSLDQMTIVTYTTRLLCKYGLKNSNEIQLVAGIYIYPKEYFCPKNPDSGVMTITDKTCSIHHYDYSWADKRSIVVQKRKEKIFKIFPAFCAQRVFDIYNHICMLLGK